MILSAVRAAPLRQCKIVHFVDVMLKLLDIIVKLVDVIVTLGDILQLNLHEDLLLVIINFHH
jgi:hypothetical protein